MPAQKWVYNDVMRMEEGLNALQKTKKKSMPKIMSPRNEGPIDAISKENVEQWTKPLSQLEKEQAPKSKATPHDKLVEATMSAAAGVVAEEEKEQEFSDETIHQSEAVTAQLTENLKKQEADEQAEHERVTHDLEALQNEHAAQRMEKDIADVVRAKYAVPTPKTPQPASPPAPRTSVGPFELHGETRPKYESWFKRFVRRHVLREKAVVDKKAPGNFTPDPKYRWERGPKKD